MKKLVAISLIGISCFCIKAQDTNPPSPAWKIVQFLSEGSNYIFAPYGIMTSDGKKFGGGIGVGYKISDFVVPTLRLDYLDKEIWMPSGSLQLQAPMRLFGKTNLVLTPFAFVGIATPISGRGADNGTAVGIFGAGGHLRISEVFGLIGDFEKWSGFDSDQIRVGVTIKPFKW